MLEITKLGYSIVPTGPDKWPSIPTWKKYQKSIATDEELKSWFPAYGVAIICGKVSGGLEVLDFDLKNDITGTLFDEFIHLVLDSIPELVNLLTIAESRSKGRHVYYKCLEIEGNKKLAGRHATEEELKAAPHLKQYGTIETRGESGIIVCSPSPGYTWIQGDLKTVPTITPEQRAELLNIARSFNSYIIAAENNHSFINIKSNGNNSPWNDYNNRGDILQLLELHGYKILFRQGDNVRIRRPGKDRGISGDFNTVKRWFTLFTTSTQFEAQKAYSPAAVFCKLECNDDWKILNTKLSAAGFGSNDISSTNEAEEQTIIIKKFWNVVKSEPVIDKTALKAFIHELGYFTYFHDPERPSFEIVKVENNLVSFSGSIDIIHSIEKYISSLPANFDGIKRTDLWNLFSNKISLVYDPKYQALFLERLDSLHKPFLKDNKNTCYIPYLNGIAVIQKDKINVVPYSKFDKLIWRSSVVKRSINIIPDYTMKCEFNSFIEFISKDLEPATWQKRKESCCTIIGYLIHRYKDRINPKAVVLMEQCDDYDKGGGTGKGLLIQALGQVVKVAIKSGKSFDPGSTFAFQDIDPATAIINISDTGAKFKVEEYNSLITDAIKTERKNKDSITLNYDESPKIVFDMNYSLVENSESALRRVIALEFSDYFGRHHSPADEFGHALIYDWDEIEFNRFDNYVINCIRLFMTSGLIELDMSKGSKAKAIKQRCGPEFEEWFNEWAESEESRKEAKTVDLYSQFLESSNKGKEYSLSAFGRSIAFACKKSGFNLNQRRATGPGRPRLLWLGSEYLKPNDELPF